MAVDSECYCMRGICKKRRCMDRCDVVVGGPGTARQQ